MSCTTIVTGAAGFIGRNTVAALNERGSDDLLLVDELGSDEKWRNLQGLVFDDLIAPNDLPRWLEAAGRPEVDAVIHLGANSSTTERDADHLLENNYRYTRRLCEWSLRSGARFVYASSAATYGDGSRGYDDSDASTPDLVPLNMYGYSKHLFDLWALRHGLFDRIVGLKFFNVYGPYEQHKATMRSVVAKAHEQISDVGYLELFRSYRAGVDDGEQRRDFIHVSDAVAVALYFVDRPDVSGLFNCGSGEARTWLDLGRAVFSAMGRDPDIRFIDMPEAIRDRYQYFTQADLHKLRAAGYVEPFLTVEQGVDRYVREHLEPARADDQHGLMAGASRDRT